MSRRGNSAGRLRRRLLALMTAVVGAAVIYFSAPRLAASWYFLPVDTAIARYYTSGDVPSAQLDALEQRAQTAIGHFAHYRYYEGLGLLRYLQALDEAALDWDRNRNLVRSLDASETAVSLAPARPESWFQIAQVRAYLGRADDTVVDALRMSIYTGRVDTSLLIPRLRLAYRYLDLLDSETVALLRDQTVLAWQVNPRAFTRAFRAGWLDENGLQHVLGGKHPLISNLQERSP